MLSIKNPNVRVKIIVEIDNQPTFEHTSEFPLSSKHTRDGSFRNTLDKKHSLDDLQSKIYHFVSKLEVPNVERTLAKKIYQDDWLTNAE